MYVRCYYNDFTVPGFAVFTGVLESSVLLKLVQEFTFLYGVVACGLLETYRIMKMLLCSV